MNHEYAIIHIPKNAGQSLMDALKTNDKIRYFSHSVDVNNIKPFKQIYVLREPISRFTSAFFYLKQYKRNRETNLFKTPEELIQSLLELDIRAMGFLKVHDHYHTIYGKKIPIDWAFSKQIDWVVDPFKFLIFDQLHSDIEKLSEFTETNIILPHINKSNKINFHYTQDSIDYLKLIYKKDFELYQNVIYNKNLTF